AVMMFVVVGRGTTTPRPDAGVPGTSRVVTQDAASEVSFGEATIEVHEHSALTLAGDAERGVFVMIERGAASFAVAPRAGRPPFVVQAGDVMVRVIGTQFMVSRSGDAARVEVTVGHVEVVARGHRVQVHAGESWSSDGEREAAARGSATGSGDVAAAHLSSDPGNPAGWEATPGSQEGQPDGAVAPGADRSGGPSQDGDPGAAQPRPRHRPVLDDKARFDHAGALEPTDPRAALAEYRALARGKGTWAANALYAAGRLSAELGDREAAAQLLRRYLDRYPHGGNAADARSLLRSLDPAP
ncbi:MAG: FecR domain-containing protein, partial [Myxococcales bacterium]|nr:FecR domain-containing protein [Myxococcales bacterium]